MQPGEGLHGAGLRERARVDHAETGLLAERENRGLRVRVIRRNEQVKRLAVLVACDDIAREDGVEGLDDRRLRRELRDLLGAGRVGLGGESGEFGVERVRGVDDDLAGETAERRDDLGHSRPRHGKGDDVTRGDGSEVCDAHVAAELASKSPALLLVAHEDLDVVARRECARGDAACDVSCPDDADGVRTHSVLLPNS